MRELLADNIALQDQVESVHGPLQWIVYSWLPPGVHLGSSVPDLMGLLFAA